MQAHLANFLDRRDSPGVVLIQSTRTIGQVIEGLLLIWLTQSPGDLRNRAIWLPAVGTHIKGRKEG